jgi:hypothetical protein
MVLVFIVDDENTPKPTPYKVMELFIYAKVADILRSFIFSREVGEDGNVFRFPEF